MGDLASMLAQGLARVLEPAEMRNFAARAAGAGARPVLQLNAFPVPLDLSRMRDAFSPDNPTGSYLAARRFRDLCDAIPTCQRYFEPSGLRVEEVWRNLVFGASGASPMTRHLLSNAQNLIGEYEIANMGGAADPWLPVNAGPSDWADLVDQAERVTLDLDGGGDGGPGYQVIGSDAGFDWTTATGDRVPVQGRVRSIGFKAIKVDLVRPWLDLQLLAMGQWSVEGHPAGFYSSGGLAQNAGLFPLLPVAMVVGQEITLEGDFSSDDRRLMESRGEGGARPSLGPFPGGPEGAEGSHVIGYINRLVPFAPQVSGAPAGVILVRNEGGFVARFSLSWRQDGVARNDSSGNFPVLVARSLAIPAGADDVELCVEVMTLPPPFETWKTVAQLRLGGAVRKGYLLSGTTVRTTFSEIPADAAPV